MKLEPVAWMYQERKGKPFASTVPPESQDPIQLSENEVTVTDLYAIPDGYVVVPVEQAKNAERYAWLRDKSFGQYAHPIVIEQRPEGFVPRYLGPLFGDILDSYVDIAIDQTANKAMIAAKEQQ